MPETVTMNATISRIFSNVIVFESALVGITKRKRIITPQIPAPSTINVLFINLSPSFFVSFNINSNYQIWLYYLIEILRHVVYMKLLFK